MNKRIVFFLACSFITLFSSAQRQEWFDAEYRANVWPSSTYYIEYYNSSLSEKDALDFAKKELSKSILTQVETKSTSSSITKNAILNDLFKENTSESSSATFVNLEKRGTFYKKKYHILIYKNKEDLKKETKNIFQNLTTTYISEVGSLIGIFNTGNLKEAKNKSDRINTQKRKLDRLKTFLSAFGAEFSTIELNQANQKFDEVRATILKGLSDEENYKINIDKAFLLFTSSALEDLEKSLELYKKAQSINPERAMEDDLSNDIEVLRKSLFNKYVKLALNFEQEQKYTSAIIYFKKARDIFPNKKVDPKNTTTEKIIFCQEENIKIILKQGDEDLEDYPKLALKTYKEARSLAIEMSNISMIKPINKKIKKAEVEIRKNLFKEERKKSSNRILLNIGGGIHTNYSYYKNIFEENIDPDNKNWNLNATVGYRTSLPLEKKTDNTGFETSKGNVLAIFLKNGVTTVPALEMGNVKFTEIEFGYIIKEAIRASFGMGNRTIGDQYKNSLTTPSNYYCGTTSLILHKNRIAIEIGATWLFNKDLEPLDAKLSGNVNLKFYFLRKIYKSQKDKI
tara:strand:+ start:3023 stop:4732 length:1710 start_codon:yes stop_codon:yes gene_type:complete